MTPKVCLRCDWSGETREADCPACGTALFASGDPSREARFPQRSRDDDVEGPGDGSTPQPQVPGPSWRRRVIGVVAVMVVFAAFMVVQTHTPSATSGGSPNTGLHGYLITSAREGNSFRLWVWDLAGATASPGPTLDALPDELVYSYGVNTSWVGLTTEHGATSEQASILRFLGPTDRPVRVATGRFVAWAADGAYVSALQETRLGGCRRRITVSTWFVAIRQEERRYRGVICGEATGLGRDQVIPYLTIERGASSTIYVVGTGHLIRGLRDRELLSASSDGSLLLWAPPGVLMLSGSPRPIPVGGARTPLRPSGVLAWSADASLAYVLGTRDGVTGVYRVIVGPRPRTRSPALVLATAAVDVHAATTADGDLYLSTDGALSLVHDGAVQLVEPPAGAPNPVGPVLWISTLPYSAPES